ncbi:MAG: serine/threonine protein kinase [Clostridia bacterium]|nr:serine/threonine protein kinase [Clostridia bacterium]
MEGIWKTYRLVSVLSDRNDSLALRIRHKKLSRDLVLHRFYKDQPVYELLCGVSCENLPAVYDVIVLADAVMVLEEFVEGMTLAEEMEIRKFPYAEAKKMIGQICTALSVLHENGFVHRDIKPQNLLITKEGRAVLIDFNISRAVTDAEHDTVVMGTVGYASPEQLGIAQSDARSDVYALGVLLNMMLTGVHPIETIPKGRPGRVIRRCMEVNPRDRYQTVSRLKAAL